MQMAHCPSHSQVRSLGKVRWNRQLEPGLGLVAPELAPELVALELVLQSAHECRHSSQWAEWANDSPTEPLA